PPAGPLSSPPSAKGAIGQSPGTIVLLVAGAAVLIGSFLDFYSAAGVSGGGGSAWSRGLFPLMTLPVLAALVVAVPAAIATFTDLALPRSVLGLGAYQIDLLLGGYAVVLMVCFLVSEPA